MESPIGVPNGKPPSFLLAKKSDFIQSVVVLKTLDPDPGEASSYEFANLDTQRQGCTPYRNEELGILAMPIGDAELAGPAGDAMSAADELPFYGVESYGRKRPGVPLDEDVGH